MLKSTFRPAKRHHLLPAWSEHLNLLCGLTINVVRHIQFGQRVGATLARPALLRRLWEQQQLNGEACGLVGEGSNGAGRSR